MAPIPGYNAICSRDAFSASLADHAPYIKVLCREPYIYALFALQGLATHQGKFVNVLCHDIGIKSKDNTASLQSAGFGADAPVCSTAADGLYS